MPDKTLTSRTALVALLALGALGLAACAQTKSFFGSLGGPKPRAADSEVADAENADQYLHELYELVSGDPAKQAEIYADARSASRLTPSPRTNLRYALVLATPGHPESNPEQAQTMLRELLAQTELLTPTEVSLATVFLSSVEQQIVADSEARRLRASTSRTAQTREDAVNQRIATVEDENRRLKRELQDAQDKLDAITSIERSIREQEP
ncbi:MAG: hypothetical protein WB812_05120 [Woeseiaceae bacterium]